MRRAPLNSGELQLLDSNDFTAARVSTPLKMKTLQFEESADFSIRFDPIAAIQSDSIRFLRCVLSIWLEGLLQVSVATLN